MQRASKDPLSGLQSTPAPPELAGPVLASAREALEARAAQTFWDRAWRNRTLRLAWGGVTIALLAAHLFMTVAPKSDAAGTARQAASPHTVAIELAAIAHLPRIEPSALGPVFETLGNPKSGLPR